MRRGTTVEYEIAKKIERGRLDGWEGPFRSKERAERIWRKDYSSIPGERSSPFVIVKMIKRIEVLPQPKTKKTHPKKGRVQR